MLDFKGKNKKMPFYQGHKKQADNGNRTRYITIINAIKSIFVIIRVIFRVI